MGNEYLEFNIVLDAYTPLDCTHKMHISTPGQIDPHGVGMCRGEILMKHSHSSGREEGLCPFSTHDVLSGHMRKHAKH